MEKLYCSLVLIEVVIIVLRRRRVSEGQSKGQAQRGAPCLISECGN